MSFFDDEAEDSLSPELRSVRGASSSRAQSIGASSSSFLDRLRSTVSPDTDPHSYPHGADRSRASASIFDTESNLEASASTSTSHFGFTPNHQPDEEGDQGEDVELLEEELREMEEMDDVKRMGMIWVKERGTNDIMGWEGDLIDGLFDKLEQQQKMVTTLRSDPQTSEEEHFKLMLVQTEMERVKYLVRSYVRTRLHKIEKYSQYITLTPSIHHLLSGAELSHARRYTELLHTHYQHSVLDSLPEWLRKMDDTYGDGLSMVTKPNKNMPVLIYCRRDCGEITLEGGERAALARGTTHLVKYRLVDRWISLGWAEVL
ncbi:hypothetical protein IAR55_003405 [Kwoniella newhampshirensis]|uniref:DNA replication complex GINS protein SLD5 n=1 Tax=Kwoniella newhampshirensis TaxID=1651941 RepID=A0AAW0YQS9_9TREE